MAFRITLDKVAAPKFKQNLAGIGDRLSAALKTAANMAASMIEEKAREDIAAGGNFSGEWVSGLHVTVQQAGLNSMRIAMTHDDPRASIFETGGVIKGSPLLWLPFSGTDAQGVAPGDYGELFSVNNPGSKHPMLFSTADKKPKYFGIESVTITKRFHLAAIQREVMDGFREIFDNAFRSTGGKGA